MTSRAQQHPLESTAQLLARAQTGDDGARSELLVRYREPLARFLRGRISPASRNALDTADVVQEVMAIALEQLPHIEYRGLGTFWSYLRRVGLNRVLAFERLRAGRPAEAHDSALLAGVADERGATPLAATLRDETSAAFEAALERIPEPARAALLLRLELGLPYRVIAGECGYPSEDAARMAIGRSLAVLSKELAAFEP